MNELCQFAGNGDWLLTWSDPVPYMAAMIIYDLECPLGHKFEGWFPSPDAFEKQQECGLLECAVCGANEVVRLPSGGHVAIARSSEKATPVPATEIEVPAEDTAPAKVAEGDEKTIKVDPVTFARYVRHLVHSKGKDVGDKFADQAIEMHRGLADAEPIYGTADSDARDRLSEEGVSYFPIPEIPEEYDN